MKNSRHDKFWHYPNTYKGKKNASTWLPDSDAEIKTRVRYFLNAGCAKKSVEILGGVQK